MIAIFAVLRLSRGRRSACLTGNTFDSPAVPKEPFRKCEIRALHHSTLLCREDFDELHLYWHGVPRLAWQDEQLILEFRTQAQPLPPTAEVIHVNPELNRAQRRGGVRW
jgi:hypothetical protein